MARATLAFFTFNRGIISRLGAARADIKRLALGAKTMLNWVSRALGSMNIRPGLGYICSTRSDAAPRGLEFVFSLSDKALIECTSGAMRVLIDDVVIQRNSVVTTITNGTFDTDIAGWTDDDEAGATSAWKTGGYMQLVGDGTANARRTQSVNPGASANVEHGLQIVIARGPVVLRIGSTSGGDEYVAETTLQTGYHSLAFTPTGTFYIRFQSSLVREVLIDSVAIEAAGDMVVTTPWTTSYLDLLQYDQSGDVLFVAAEGLQQRRIERRADRSWSCVKYYADDGPFRIENVTPITMTPGALNGNTTMTASQAYWTSENVGGLISHTSTGQRVTASASAANTFTSSIRVVGTGTSRAIGIDISGTWVATVQLQRSLDSSTGPWTDVPTWSFTANATSSYTDGLDNQEVWYRIGVKPAAYTSGTVVMVLSISTGSIRGVGRITGFTSSTVVDVEVLSDFGGTNASDVWAEGLWSDRRGWPSGVALAEGRLWWGGKDRILGSVSDAFDSFNPDTVGDSGPISRTIGAGPVDSINWLLALQRLILGAQGAEFSCRSTSLDEPLTPSNFNMKPSSTQGSASVRPCRVDTNGIYVQRGGVRVFELAIDPQTYDYASTNLTAVCPEIGRPKIIRAAFQRQPEPRWHGVRSDGKVALLAFDKSEQLICWSLVDTGGTIVDVAVLPGDPGEEEDHVYYAVQRTINGSVKCYWERWATELDCRPDDNGALELSHLCDAHVEKLAVNSTTITGLSHLEGKMVCVWADGVDLSTNPAVDDHALQYTVAGGSITVDRTVTNCVVGLPYDVQWQSGKLLQIPMQMGTPINQYKTIANIGAVLADTHAQGLRFGRNFTDLDDMPSEEMGAFVDHDTIHVDYEEQEFPFPGDWSVDSRLCLVGQTPRPVTVVAVTADTQATE